MRLLFIIPILFLIMSCDGEVENYDARKADIILTSSTELYAGILETEEDVIDIKNDPDLSGKIEEQNEIISSLMATVQKIEKDFKIEKSRKISNIKTVKPKNKVSIKQLLKDKAFKLKGHWGQGTSCRGLIYRKDFQRSRMYLHVDCYGNYTKQQVWRK